MNSQPIDKCKLEHFHKRYLEEKNAEKDKQIDQLRSALKNIIAMDDRSGPSMKIVAAMVLASTES